MNARHENDNKHASRLIPGGKERRRKIEKLSHIHGICPCLAIVTQ
jgi:hypothetical protein